MPRHIIRILPILLIFAALGCGLSGRSQDQENQIETETPTQASADVLLPATHTAVPPTSAPPSVSPQATRTAILGTTPTKRPQLPSPTATLVPPTATPSPTPSPPPSGGLLQELIDLPLPADVSLIRESVVRDDYASAEMLETNDVPIRDIRELAIRLKGVRPDVPPTISDSSPDYPVGTVRSFKVHNSDNQEIFLVDAELRYETDHVYMWVEKGARIDQAQLERAADIFESRIYPINRDFFGSEWTPGVDGDPHLSVLHAGRIDSGVAGYYSSAHEYPAEVRPDSNQMEMFFINADNANVGDAFYLGVLAHEFQHMIHWHNDRNEETWLNEGMSELAFLINGFDPSGSDYAWSIRPDTQLNTWSQDDARSAHYGAAYLFSTYLLDRFGEELTKAVVAHPANGITSIDAVLAENETGLTFTDIFADWAVAAYLDDPELADGRFGFELVDTNQPELDTEHKRYPVERTSDVAPYGVDFIYLDGGADLTLDFYGDTRARLLDTQPHSGDHFWYSNRADDSDMRLTRSFDLSDLSQATLRFWIWHDIEKDYDYGYVMVSTDDGATWQILHGPHTTDTNPNGNNYGWGFTGRSGGVPIWIEEQIDLSPYAGQEILLRFEYVTDDALNNPGWAIDDIAVPELGYQDDVENGDGGWLAEGFVRTNNFVPQSYMVQLITFGEETTVQRLPLQPDQSARWRLPLADAHHGVLTVSALARVTTEPAGYFYRLAQE